MPDGHSMIISGCREQEPGHELAGRGRVHRHLTPGEAPAAMHGQWHPVAVDACAQGPQCIQERVERTFTHARVAIEHQVTVGQCGQRRGEPGDRTGVAAVDQSTRGSPQREFTVDDPVAAVVEHGDPERAQRGGHEQRVA